MNHQSTFSLNNQFSILGLDCKRFKISDPLFSWCLCGKKNCRFQFTRQAPSSKIKMFDRR